MPRILLVLMLVGLVVGSASAQYADYAFVPPAAKSDGALAAERFPLPQADAKALLGGAFPTHVLAAFSGKNAALKADTTKPAWRVAANTPVELFAPDLFAPVKGQPGRFMGAITSRDALALRLRVDLDGFSAGQRLYLIDTNGERTFGPYSAADARPEGAWLPTTLGDSVALLLESDKGALPALYVEELSHFYQSPAEKDDSTLPCPIPAGCETDPVAVQVSTSEAMIIVPLLGGQVQCSGTLLNRMGTPDYAALFITAHHCFEGGGVDAKDIDAYWDYRSGSCDPAVVAPDLYSMPHSQGDELLAQSTKLDAQFLRLADAPVGAYGRAWAGWDTRLMAAGDLVQGFHFPRGKHMKTCRGSVIETGVTECLDLLCTTRYDLQNAVRWDEGITEAGSSGSGLFLRGVNYRLCGVLSNGTTHICGRPENNRDNYSSFKDFFPAIACYLADGMECTAPESSCFLSNIFGKDSDTARELRDFRDGWLSGNPWGQAASRAYYKMSGKIIRRLP